MILMVFYWLTVSIGAKAKKSPTSTTFISVKSGSNGGLVCVTSSWIPIVKLFWVFLFQVIRYGFDHRRVNSLDERP